MHPRAQRVLDFWLGPGWDTAPTSDARSEMMPKWFSSSPELDQEMTELFQQDCEALMRGDYDDWQRSDGDVNEALAGIIIGDQFCRNIYRGTGKMYMADPKVLGWCSALVDSGRYRDLKLFQRPFIVLPYMHSEVLADQDRCIELAKELKADAEKIPGAEGMVGMAGAQVGYGQRHRDIIAKWGRFPHRNALVGRESTPEEVAGLADGSIEKF